MLEYLVTDAWFPPWPFLPTILGYKSKLAERFHDELSEARVKSFNSSLILFETLTRARERGMWPSVIARNRWFQRKVVAFLRSHLSTINYQPILLSYSYTALEPFRYAKTRGCKSVLVQIDPGPEEEKIVAKEAARVPQMAAEWQPAPDEYWTAWHEECDLADRIVVNSEWSREGLIRGGVSGEKISIIPLAYEGPAAFAEASAAKEVGDQRSDVGHQQAAVRCRRSYPACFTRERPLRVLFLGLINLRKGIARLLEAARILCNEPVEFWMVGPVEIANATTVADTPRVKWFGPVNRNRAAEFYTDADVFIVPTLSDGFAITQLEAQAHGLPIIASKFCGQVVQNGLNGIVLQEPNAKCIAQAIRDCISDPNQLRKLAAASRVGDEFTIQSLAHHLHKLGASL